MWIFVIVAVAVLAIAFSLCWQEQLSEKQEWLDKREVQLDERANKLSAWEADLIVWQRAKDRRSEKPTSVAE